MNNVTKALSISKQVKERVFERDGGCCILCGRAGLPEAHYIPRSKLGLGIEENIVTLCRDCHRRYDQTAERENLGCFIRGYLKAKYPNFKDEERVYVKGR